MANDWRSSLERGIPQGVFVGALGLMFTAMLQARDHLPQGILVTLAGGVVAGALAMWINRALISGSGRAATAIYAPSGNTTAYTPTFSHIETLEIRGDLDGAARAWDEAIAEDATNTLVRVRAADFHLRARRDHMTAARLYREARDIGTPNDDLRRYIAQKLVDLYLGPLADEGKVMGELRRLIDAFPGTREADSAREALAKLKALKTRDPTG